MADDDEVFLVPLPPDAGVEPIPDREGLYRLVVKGTADLHRLRNELDIILYGASAAEMEAARSDSPVVRRLSQQRSPFELQTGPCPVAGCTTDGAHVHRNGGPASHPAGVEVSGPDGETPASTEGWSSADWLAWLTGHGITQLQALRRLREQAAARGEEPTSSIRAAVGTPEGRARLIAQAREAAAGHRNGTDPW
jgi:hypothetical protein